MKARTLTVMGDLAKPFQTVQGLKKIPRDFLLAD
jgi:hypothetical protein